MSEPKNRMLICFQSSRIEDSGKIVSRLADGVDGVMAKNSDMCS